MCELLAVKIDVKTSRSKCDRCRTVSYRDQALAENTAASAGAGTAPVPFQPNRSHLLRVLARALRHVLDESVRILADAVSTNAIYDRDTKKGNMDTE